LLSAAVPLIVIFTKFDALDDDAFDCLDKEGLPWEDAKQQAPVRAVADFEKVHLRSLYKSKYPPRGHVYLRGMILSYATRLVNPIFPLQICTSPTPNAMTS
jgi:hypothetical protein